ncbi:hypothetical protein ABQF35_21805 [Mycobacterium syngnathidarum]
MPKPLPAESRADVIAVARKGEAPLRQIAKDFGISEACLLPVDEPELEPHVKQRNPGRAIGTQ